MSNQQPDSQSLSYQDAGVDIGAGNELVERIKPAVKRTNRPGVMGGIGGFGALFELPLGDYRNPVLVSGTDGVGTKLKLASLLGRHDTIGIDLVAMCVNDIVVAGAEPLFFLDYFATGKLDIDQAEVVINGIAEGCCQAGCALTGGETAEMPGMYQPGDYDLAGFAVGIVEKDKMQDPSRVKAGQVLLGLGSSGPHSNGFSLIRKVLERSKVSPDMAMDGSTLGEKLMKPTRIYVKSILKLLEAVPVSAISHITGGGISENLPRVLPSNVAAQIDRSSWQQPTVFRWLQEQGNIQDNEMLKTFNCGLGMIVAVEAEDVAEATAALESSGEAIFQIGSLVTTDGPSIVQYIS